MNPDVRGVLFDMGGTLFRYDTRADMGRATTDALARLGLDPESAPVRAARRAAGDEVSRAYASRPFFLHADLFRDRFTATLARLGQVADDEIVRRFDAENLAAILRHMVPRDDARATLTALRGRGLHVGLVSNADDAWVEPALDRHGLVRLFDAWTSSEEARSCKPDPAIFEVALGKANLEPGTVLMVGDSLPHDVAGARAAGLRSVHLVADEGPTPLGDGLDGSVRPDFTVDALGRVVDLVDELRGRAG